MMKTKSLTHIRIFLVIPFVMMGFSPALFASSPGTSAANFLKMGVGARGAAMGEAQVAVGEGVNATYWNPASLSNLRFKEISLMHYQMVEGIRYQNMSYGLPTPRYGHLAFGVSLMNYGSISGYDETALPTGSVEASNLLMNVAWADTFFEKSKLSFGANLKYLNSNLAGYKASAPILDAGVQFPFEAGKFRGLSLGAAVKNIGPDLKYDTGASPLPQQFVLGAGLNVLGGNLTLAMDLVKPRDNSSYVATGLEYNIYQMIHLRAGYSGLKGFVGEGYTFGIGLKFTQWYMDYAFVPFGDLGSTNRVSVGYRFGQALKLKTAEDQVELAYRKAERLYDHGQGVAAYSTVIDLLLIAPWYKPAEEMKVKIEKQFSEMEHSKNKARMESEISDEFTLAKAAFDRDELVGARRGFTAILSLQPEHVGARVYMERIKSRYASLAQESFKLGMDHYAAGDYVAAAKEFEKTLTIDESHQDARAMLLKTKELVADRTKRIEEIKKLAGAADSYKEGLKLYQEKQYEKALARFQEVQALVPEYEEVNRYSKLTMETLSSIYFEESKILIENGQMQEAVEKLNKASVLNPADNRIKTALGVAERDLGIQNSRDSKRLYQEGLEAYLSGRTDKAENLWKEALQLDSSNDDALKALSKLEEQKSYAKPNQDK